MVDDADVAMQRWGRSRFVRIPSRRSGRTPRPAVTAGAVIVVDVVYEEQAGAHGDGQKHGCSMALGDMTKKILVSKTW